MRKILNLLLILIVCGCKSNSTDCTEYKNCKTFEISFKKDYKEKIYLSEMLDSEEFIQLETLDECLISDINKLIAINNKYYIYDRVEDVIFIFSKDGKFLNKISEKGRGPGQYISIACFDVNPKTNEINILDLNSKRMIVYDDNCQLNRTIEINDIVRDFMICENGDYLFFTNDKNEGSRRGLWRCDNTGLFKEQLVEIDEDFDYGGHNPYYLQRINIDLIGFMGLEDKGLIYHITNDAITPRYNINVDMKISDDIINSSDRSLKDYKGMTYKFFGYVETYKYIKFVTSNLDDKNILLYYDKINDTCKKITEDEDFIYDTDFLMLGTLVTEYNDKMISHISALKIMDTPELKDKFPNVDENSNPFLGIYKF